MQIIELNRRCLIEKNQLIHTVLPQLKRNPNFTLIGFTLLKRKLVYCAQNYFICLTLNGQK